MRELKHCLLVMLLVLPALTVEAHFQNFLARIVYLADQGDDTLIYARIPLASLLIEHDWKPQADDTQPPYTRQNDNDRPVLDLAALARDDSLLRHKAAAYFSFQMDNQQLMPAVEALRIQPIATRSPFGHLATIKQTLTLPLELPSNPLLLEEAIIDLKLRISNVATAQISQIASPSNEWPTIRDQAINILTLPGDTFTSSGALALTLSSPPGILSQLSNQITSGVRHVLIGIDHLLFMCVLVLGAGSWKRIVHNSLMFTAGHSITLGLVALGLLIIPPTNVPLIETLIALSIFYGFCRVLMQPDKPSLPLWQIGGIGLLHGLGFANVLEKATGTGAGELIVHWLGFNLGIEAGQIVVFATLTLLLAAVRRIGRLTPRQITGTVAVPSLIMATYWTLERGWMWVSTLTEI
ncbi:Membrane protein [Marinobacterium lacunae]|uniref:Membrane protein n=1 Tax=Marinobacterium lacunae TaxID=1232683 RepID=A0A081G4D6_9GAMM|nr:HupE/UreJ family protein [Marinobacterium lacunae]KEA65641.1 Membrane protein [Marinobacterium lacunae]